MSIDIVVAQGKNREIGQGNQLLWKMGEMKTDMSRFRDLTIGTSVVMGRKTFNSIGSQPLPGRNNIVLTKDPSFESEAVVVAHSIDEAIELAKESSPIVNIIGGAAIYAQTLGIAQRIHATEVDADFPKADTHFPEINPLLWREIDREYHEADGDNVHPFSFVEYLYIGRDYE